MLSNKIDETLLSIISVLPMPRVKLTARFVRRCVCPPGKSKIDYFDLARTGFLVEVRPTGRRTFYQRYVDEHGRERQYRIGPADVLTLDQARSKAKQVVAEALLGPDPQQKRRELRRVPLLREFAAERYLPYVRGYKITWTTDETVLRVHILPRLGGLPLDEIKPEAVSLLANAMREDGYAAGTINRAIVIIRYMYNLARKWDVPGALKNPAVGLSAGPDVQRNRFLSKKEAEALMHALHADENQTAARSIMLLLLTGARRNEITYAKWDYIDWTNKTLLVPKSKSGRARVISLNPTAIALLRSIPRIEGAPYIFPSRTTGRPSASLFFPWDRIRNRAGLDDLRLHDLRHSFASFLVNRGASLYVVQGLLGHLHARTTQRYAHLTQETLAKAAELVEDVIAVPVSAAEQGGEEDETPTSAA
jgi:integrase